MEVENMGRVLGHIREAWATDYPDHWSHLSRMNNLFVILNISMFFLTELVTRYRYYYTFYSLLCLGLVYIGLLLPLGLLKRLWYYLVFVAIEVVGVYFMVVSGWYWVITNRS